MLPSQIHLLDAREKRHSFQNNFYFCHFVNRTCVGFLMSFFGSTRSWGLFAAKCIPSTKKYDGGYSTKKEKFLPHTWLENWLYKRAINPKKEALTNVLIASLASYTPSANCSLEFRPMFTLTTDHVVNKIRSLNLTHRHFTTKSCSSCVNYCKKFQAFMKSIPKAIGGPLLRFTHWRRLLSLIHLCIRASRSILVTISNKFSRWNK